MLSFYPHCCALVNVPVIRSQIVIAIKALN
jgi:hypothetical protein